MVTTATKTHGEKTDEETRRLVRPSPDKNPPRRDLRRERVKETDSDVDEDGDTKSDKDMSLNYKSAVTKRVDTVLEMVLGQNSRNITLAREQELVDAAIALREEETSRGGWEGLDLDRYVLDHVLWDAFGNNCSVDAFRYDRMLRQLKGEDQPWPRAACTIDAARNAVMHLDPILAFDLNDVLVDLERFSSSQAVPVFGESLGRASVLSRVSASGLTNVEGTCESADLEKVALLVDRFVSDLLNGGSVTVSRRSASGYNGLYGCLLREVSAAVHRSLSQAGLDAIVERPVVTVTKQE